MRSVGVVHSFRRELDPERCADTKQLLAERIIDFFREMRVKRRNVGIGPRR